MVEKKEEKESFKVGEIYPIEQTTGYQVVAELNEKGEPLILMTEDENIAWIIKTLAEIKEMLSKIKEMLSKSG